MPNHIPVFNSRLGDFREGRLQRNFAEVFAPPLPLQASTDLNMSNNSSNTYVTPCFKSKEAMVSFVTVSITILLLVFPVFICVFRLRCQKWRQQCSTSTPMSYFDIFLCHSIALDLISVLGYTLFFFGDYFNHVHLFLVGGCFWMVASFAQTLLHVLTCVERYLAVVKPITYQGVKQTHGVRIRNISIGCVWLLSFIYLIVALMSGEKFNLIFPLCTMGFFLFVVSFSSISVLCILKNPEPGEPSGNRQRVNQSKQKAFYITMAITVALVFRFGGTLLIYIIFALIKPGHSKLCPLRFLAFYSEIPSSLVLPLLVLHGVGALQCKQTSEYR